MQEAPAEHPQPLPPAGNSQIPTVAVVSSWKDHAREAMLIVFSVLLALLLTEAFNNYHDAQKTRSIIQQLRNELIRNKEHEEEQYKYHLQVIKNIDSALQHPDFGQQFIQNGMMRFNLLAPDGVLLYDLNDVAWQVARQDNIISKIDITTYSLLTTIYDNQQRFSRLEQEVAGVVLSRESRTAPDTRITLFLLRDNYQGWVVERAPELLEDYQSAIDALSKLD